MSQYQFLKKSQSQPDMQDFTTYCKPILSKIELLQDRIKSQKEGSSVEFSHIERRLATIVQVDLPSMVDNFFNTSLQWRNTQVIKSGKTAKDILLENLAAIESSVNELELEFFNVYKKSLLSQNTYLKSLAGNSIMSSFKNKFNFQEHCSYSSNMLLTSATQGAANSSVPIQTIKPETSESYKKRVTFVYECMMLLVASAVISGVCISTTNSIATNIISQEMSAGMVRINATAKSVSAPLGGKTSLVFDKRYTEMLFKNQSNIIQVKSFTVQPQSHSYSIAYSIDNSKECTASINAIPNAQSIYLTPKNEPSKTVAIRQDPTDKSSSIGNEAVSTACQMAKDGAEIEFKSKV